MFDHSLSSPFSIMVGFVSDKASVHPRISDDVVMHVVVKGGVFEFIGCGHTKTGLYCVCPAKTSFNLF